MIAAVRKPAVERSPKWAALRHRVLKGARCAACGGTQMLEVHHKRPFHLFPHLELVPSNLIVLCERKRSGLNCHLLIGHLGNYRAWNPNVQRDAREWFQKLRTRPFTKEIAS